jgi:hypothetical protein
LFQSCVWEKRAAQLTRALLFKTKCTNVITRSL